MLVNYITVHNLHYLFLSPSFAVSPVSLNSKVHNHIYMIHININNLHILRPCIKTKPKESKGASVCWYDFISIKSNLTYVVYFQIKPHSCTIRGILPQEVHFVLLICSEMTILDRITCQRLSLAKIVPFFSLNSHWLPVALHLEVWTYHSCMSTGVFIIQLFFSQPYCCEVISSTFQVHLNSSKSWEELCDIFKNILFFKFLFSESNKS